MEKNLLLLQEEVYLDVSEFKLKMKMIKEILMKRKIYRKIWKIS